MTNPIGIYEKAMPRAMSWPERFAAAKNAGYDFMELSIDESAERLDRLNWSLSQRIEFTKSAREMGITVPSLCLSGHRKFPFGSENPDIRKEALSIMEKAIQFAVDTGIRVIQLAGYDVYYEKHTQESRERYYDGMEQALEIAARYQVMLGLEIMDTTFLNSISKYLVLKERLRSPWFKVYPDIGNLNAWGNDMERELTLGINEIVGVHVKETKSVGPDFPGCFRDVPFGEGTVDFERIFSILKNLNYAGPFLIEMWTEKAPDPIQEIMNAREWIGDRLKKGGF